MKQIEILSPAGRPQSVIAAVNSGADSVYLGLDNFNARRGAENFDRAALSRAIQYCHENGVKVYLTLNTLVFDSEIKELLSVIQTACEEGVDAIIVQSLGVYQILKDCAKDIPLHASTQMSVFTPKGAEQLLKMGFKRIVLPRELSLEQIKKITRNVPVETEVFVHGALCMSFSGQCYMSVMLGTKSANRGLCAQSCRLPFSAKGTKGKTAPGYTLSLKDMSLTEHVKELEEAGVTALKIEGRKKRPEYVAAATMAVKAAREGKAPDMKLLRAVFCRSGFTDKYFFGKTSADMFGVRTKEDIEKSQQGLLKKITGEYTSRTPQKISHGDFAIKTIPKSFTPMTIIKKGSNRNTKLKLRGIFQTVQQFPTEKEGFFEYLLFPPDEILANSKILDRFKDKIIINPTRVHYGRENEIIQKLEKLQSLGFDKLTVNNLAYISIGRELGMTLFGGVWLNAENSYSVDFLAKEGLNDITLSPELNKAQMRDINSIVPTGAVIYGRFPLMITRNCPLSQYKSCGDCHNTKSKICENITDRKNKNFPVYCNGYGYSEVLNADVLYMADKLHELEGLNFGVLMFTAETKEEAAKVIQQYINGEKADGGFTHGMFYRKAE